MPELPEVETVVRQLRRTVCFRTIEQVEVKDRKVISAAVAQGLPVRIVEINRRGKSIVFHLDDGSFLLAHLRMTGHFHVVQSGSRDVSYQKYLSGIFRLDDQSFFTFNEIRRFGGITRVSASKLDQAFARLGKEPLDVSFTFALFAGLLDSAPQAIIKTKLLDQSFVAGLGNIYAQEALHRAGIDPRKKIREISASQRKKLYREIRAVLRQAIECNGTTIQNFSHLDGKGEFQGLLTVYQKEKCPKKHPLEKIVQGGRSTYYCPRCQR
ncbi:bifunctional DNA-formamidopyrimidine glycosylase/DNA-(apurinic or apyrimidinic site) lyase [Candidatus Woesearchaeota archaeon]|nr:bifunctional DNA-formamidopyrimidine glycosylase/DNA-(apurinic or apyrimidinic site) lyase [Candidatus Woesearchaeota archaeon]